MDPAKRIGDLENPRCQRSVEQEREEENGENPPENQSTVQGKIINEQHNNRHCELNNKQRFIAA